MSNDKASLVRAAFQFCVFVGLGVLVGQGVRVGVLVGVPVSVTVGEGVGVAVAGRGGLVGSGAWVIGLAGAGSPQAVRITLTITEGIRKREGFMRHPPAPACRL